MTALVNADVIEAALKLASRAPSFHNSQPWQWVFDRRRLHLFIDPDRVVHTDRSGRQTLISCGAVLDHFRVALAAAGWTAEVTRLPDRNDPRHVASMDLRPLPEVADTDRRRAEAIERRRTDRLPFAAPTDWESFRPALSTAVDCADVFVDVIGDDARHRITEASELSEALRMYDSSYHAELDWWTAPFDTHDGIPPSSLISAAESDRVGVGRNFPVTSQPERRVDLGEDKSQLVVLSTRREDRQDLIRCGEALSSVLLECTLAGLATCTLTHIVEVAASRDILSALVAQPHPQLLIRVGTAPAAEETVATPRRPVADFLRYRI